MTGDRIRINWGVIGLIGVLWILTGCTVIAPPPVQQPSPLPACDQEMAIGNLLDGVLDPKINPPVFCFSGTVGQIISIYLAPTQNNELSAFFELLDPTGKVIVVRADSFDVEFGFPAVEKIQLAISGQYTVLIGLTEPAAAQAYELNVIFEGTSNIPAACRGAIQFGQSLERRITTAGIPCEITFEGKSGVVVSIRMTALEAGLNPLVILTGPSTSWTYDDCGLSTDVCIRRTLPETGTYTIWASSSGGESTGRFQLTLN